MKNNRQQTHHILITGGNGLVGKSLTQALLRQGHRVSHLSRTPAIISDVTTYGWNVVDPQIDARCQWVPWIHLQDVVGLYGLAVRDSSLAGVVNQTAPGLLTNRQFMEALARHFQKPLWMPSIPTFMLKLMMGERSVFVLNSARAVPPERLLQAYRYTYPTLDKALNAIYA